MTKTSLILGAFPILLHDRLSSNSFHLAYSVYYKPFFFLQDIFLKKDRDVGSIQKVGGSDQKRDTWPRPLMAKALKGLKVY